MLGELDVQRIVRATCFNKVKWLGDAPCSVLDAESEKAIQMRCRKQTARTLPGISRLIGASLYELLQSPIPKSQGNLLIYQLEEGDGSERLLEPIAKVISGKQVK